MADEPSLTVLADRAAVSDLLLEFARALDSKEWTICRRCLLDEIETDYSDLRGEPPARVNAEDFVAKRRMALYTHSLVRTSAGWKIAKIKQTVHWNTGNPEIHAGAKP
jgi:hypothetical protein